MSFEALSPVIFESVSNVTATNSVEIGTRVTTGGRTYCYVYNGGNSQISVGRGATLSATSGYTVTVSSITMVDAFVGVCYHATIPTGQYGWLVTRGNTKVAAVANTAIAAADVLGVGVDGGFAPMVPAGTATTQGFIHGKATVATASAGIGEAFVHCLF